MRRLARLLAISFALGLAAPALLAPPDAAAATKKAKKKRGKDARTKFRAGRPPPSKRHDPIKPPPPRPPEPPKGMFHSLLGAGREWRFEARLDGRPLEVAVVLRVASVTALGKSQLVELTTAVAGAPATGAPPADLAGLPVRLLFAVTETPKLHSLTDLLAPPIDAKALLKELARRGPALTDPPSPRPDFWRAGAYRGAQERRVNFPAGTAPASCYRWGTLVDGVLDATELCQDLDHGPVLLTRRQGGHVLELAQAAPDGQARIDLPGPPSER